MESVQADIFWFFIKVKGDIPWAKWVTESPPGKIYVGAVPVTFIIDSLMKQAGI